MHKDCTARSGSYEFSNKTQTGVLGNCNYRVGKESVNLEDTLKFNLIGKNKDFAYLKENFEKTHKIHNENFYSSKDQHNGYFRNRESVSPLNTVVKIKDSISEILDESMKTQINVKRLKEKLDSIQNSKENSSHKKSQV
jgi:hypothetical protein